MVSRMTTLGRVLGQHLNLTVGSGFVQTNMPAAASVQFVRLMGHGSHASDNDPDVLEREKHKNLKGETGEHIPGVKGWNQHLASDSEAAVKADKHAPDHPDDLQKHTVEYLQKKDKTTSNPTNKS